MERKNYNGYISEIAGKKITIFPSIASDRPIIYLNTAEEEISRLHHILCHTCCPDFTLVAISRLKWEHDMSPWKILSVSKSAAPCTGGAEEYLQLLTSEIIPETEKYLQSSPVWRGLAGYSLAGLFAVYALYRTALFSRAASISGSLWFPHLKEYLFSHEIPADPDCLYFSLGNQEAKTKNPYLKTVQENTKEIEAFFCNKGVHTVFESNPGNHFHHVSERTAAGILWLLHYGI